MATTDWDRYGTGNYEKCADCMVHSGYEATAVVDAVRKPWKTLLAALRGPRTEGAMAPEISLAGQRPAEYVFSRHVQHAMASLAPQPPPEDAHAAKQVAEVADDQPAGHAVAAPPARRRRRGRGR